MSNKPLPVLTTCVRCGQREHCWPNDVKDFVCSDCTAYASPGTAKDLYDRGLGSRTDCVNAAARCGGDALLAAGWLQYHQCAINVKPRPGQDPKKAKEDWVIDRALEYAVRHADQPELYREKQLMRLAERYHQRTEAYDRTVCSGPIVGGAITPATDSERTLIVQHARGVRRELEVEADRLGIAPERLHSAITQFSREAQRRHN